MKNVRFLVIILSFVVLTGCSSTKLIVERSYTYQLSDVFTQEVIDEASVPEKGMSLFKARLEAQMSQFGLSTSNDANKKIEITFIDYKMRHGAARALGGFMAGTDNISTIVVIKDVKSDETIARLKVTSRNKAAVGTSKGLIEDHADKIVTYIKTGKY
ncbi:hypothetical protein HJP15_10975 [Pseudoalteromonas sp. NEC-BIFX-2020_002]|uniref:DUF4410 domain-containing protein n=1 Tax=Pseudoalteromonas neustonica TaxID=1840331 RepID=A0ABU9U4J7_9GAMM|nr:MULTISPECIES: DUF4410 domain-containing protein [Pseudoalteromonas]NNG43432.1 hypothetical protein [Pseudoalteromonas sp. NEC-BIFX-2020_002]